METAPLLCAGVSSPRWSLQGNRENVFCVSAEKWCQSIVSHALLDVRHTSVTGETVHSMIDNISVWR